MTQKGVENSVSKFVEILFTPISYPVDVCYAAGSLKVRASLWSLNAPFHLLNPTNNPDS